MRLFVLRHAKSSWRDGGLADADRPLSPRGVRAAEQVAALLAAHPDPPRCALCSTARRTVDTLAPILRRLELRCETSARLYLATPRELWRSVSACGDAAAPLLVVGHNPGLHEFVCELVGSGEPAARRRLAERFPTGALAEIEIDGDAWRAIAPGAGRLVALTTPR